MTNELTNERLAAIVNDTVPPLLHHAGPAERKAMAAELLAARETIAAVGRHRDQLLDLNHLDNEAARMAVLSGRENKFQFGAMTTRDAIAEVVAQRDAARAEVERVAKQRDELIGRAMKMLEPIETMRVTRDAFGVGYDQVPDAICRLIGFAKSLVDAIAAEQPKPAGGA